MQNFLLQDEMKIASVMRYVLRNTRIVKGKIRLRSRIAKFFLKKNQKKELKN